MALEPSSGWSYYKQIDISDAANVSANYQMRLTVYAGEGEDDTADGIIYCDNHCENFPNDIRFGTRNDPSIATQLAQWIEESDATSATIWVKCPSDGSDTFYMFVGNSSASQYSDGENTFIFFDDFESYDTDKWQTDAGSPEISGNTWLRLKNGVKVKTVDTFVRPKRFFMKVKIKHIESNDDDFHLMLANQYRNNRDDDIDFDFDTSPIALYLMVHNDNSGGYRNISYTSDTIYKCFAKWKSDEVKMYIDGKLKYAQSSPIPDEALNIRLEDRYGNGDEAYIDYVAILKYASTEPAWSYFSPWIDMSEVQSNLPFLNIAFKK